MTIYRGCIKLTPTKKISFIPRSIIRDGYYRGLMLWTPEIYKGGDARQLFKDAEISNKERCATRIIGVSQTPEGRISVIPEWEYNAIVRDGIIDSHVLYKLADVLVDNRWLFDTNIATFYVGNRKWDRRGHDIYKGA